ncbi:DUF6157 family protein [Sphingobacterium deserti]|uniref:Uncharacterized protein n=1 Tax=Sphingobacterium deserti TaxID=1229276 RepID=A0A0B8T682_9SPHI|nr:DUF6157 family protein [Sphingobacterium deserti]KGE13424.1 hypothetical protein DI53_2955 [Sphingobacterium deserti]
MKKHSTNYYNSLITTAEDSKADQGSKPPEKTENKTIAQLQFDLIGNSPFHYTSDEVLFLIYAQKNDLHNSEVPEARERFFSKGQPCLRTSPLAKTYGWGILSNDEGKVKLVDSASPSYQELLADDSIKKISAMRSKR